jgi:hypothetical protein
MFGLSRWMRSWWVATTAGLAVVAVAAVLAAGGAAGAAAANLRPICNNLNFNLPTSVGGSVSIPVGQFAADPDLDPITLVSVFNGGNNIGTVTISNTGASGPGTAALKFTLTGSQTGSVFLYWTVSDGSLEAQCSADASSVPPGPGAPVVLPGRRGHRRRAPAVCEFCGIARRNDRDRGPLAVVHLPGAGRTQQPADRGHWRRDAAHRASELALRAGGPAPDRPAGPRGERGARQPRPHPAGQPPRPADELGRLVATFNGMLAELDAAYRSLGQSNERMRQFLADCSHELRAPLTRVRSATDLLCRLGDDDPESRSRTITAAATETDRMSALVRNLLLLADDITLHTPMAGEPDGVVVDGDADHLEQLVLILPDNAFKYTPPPGEVWLDAHAAGTEVLISIRDSGLGIPAEDLPPVFDRFYRGRNANAASGTGLGLAIARWIAGQHGGHIDGASTPGEGSTFTLHLPLA